jgi:hypothetical protein
MKLSKFFLVGAIFFSAAAFADQEAAWVCSNKNVTLVGIKTYNGDEEESQKLTQTLYTLKRADGSYIAYFVDEQNNEDSTKAGTLVLSGKNLRRATYEVMMKTPQDVSDGSIIRLESGGLISYSYGNFKGDKEPVSCVFE